nr:MAG TPA: tail assembly chaperone protein [Caudoviricetes sp.]
MDRCTYVNIAGKNYPMSFSLGAAKRIISKFGSVEKLMKSLEKKGDDFQKIDIAVDLLETLISQGCAYKNYFEKDLPFPLDAPIEDGKWIPIPKEAIEIMIEIYDLEEIMKKLMECIKNGSKKKVELQPDKKNV